MSDDGHRNPNESDQGRQSLRSTSSRARASDSTSRSDRMRDRTEEEQEAKRRARRSTNRSRSPTPGASLTGTHSSDQAHRRSRRTEEEQQAKRRARDGSGPSPPNNNENAPVNNTRQIAPSTRAAGNQSGAVELQAELVDEEEEIERVRQQQQQENERLRAQMEAENEEYRRRLNNNSVEAEVLTVEASHVNSDSNDGGKFKQCAIAVLILVLLAGAGVGAYFGLNQSQTTSLPVPTMSPTFSPPTQIPTQVLVYPKPSSRDCQAVISGGSVEGQETMSTRSYEVQLVVSMQEETNINEILDALRLITQVLLIPELVGCFGENVRKLVLVRHRRAQERNVRRYAIANGKFISNSIADQSCISEGDGPCHLVITMLNLAVKDEKESDSVLLGLLTDIYGVDDLRSKLLLGPPFESITLGGIKAVTSDSAPIGTIAPAASPTTTGNDDLLPSNPEPSPTAEPESS